MLYRITQEQLSNILKHARAKNVVVELSSTPDQVELTIEDDGIGFNTDQIEKSNGLKNIRDRADRVGAVLRIQSEKNKGARITLDFKLTKEAKYGHAF